MNTVLFSRAAVLGLALASATPASARISWWWSPSYTYDYDRYDRYRFAPRYSIFGGWRRLHGYRYPTYVCRSHWGNRWNYGWGYRNRCHFGYNRRANVVLRFHWLRSRHPLYWRPFYYNYYSTYSSNQPNQPLTLQLNNELSQVCRAKVNDQLYIGTRVDMNCHVAFGDSEIIEPTFEVLAPENN